MEACNTNMFLNVILLFVLMIYNMSGLPLSHVHHCYPLALFYIWAFGLKFLYYVYYCMI